MYHPHQMRMPVSVSYHYDDGSWSGPQMIQNNFQNYDGYSVFSFNPEASEFVPSYWKPVEEQQQPFDGTVMADDGGSIYDESYNFAPTNIPYVSSSSGVIPTPCFEGGQESTRNSLYTMPPSGQDVAENLQTYPKAPSKTEHQVKNGGTTNTIESNEQCKNTCCRQKAKESLENDEAPSETLKKDAVADKDAKKTEECEVVPVPVIPIKCFPLYGFIGYHYSMPDPPLPNPQKLVKITSSKDNQSRLVVQPASADQASPPKVAIKEQTSPPVPQFSAMPLPLLPIPQVPAVIPNNLQFLAQTPHVAARFSHILNSAKIPKE